MQSRYHVKRRSNRGDFYGRWDNGVQKVTDRINGKPLVYNHRKQTWNGKASSYDNIKAVNLNG